MAKPIKITVKGTDHRGDDAPTVEDLLSQVQDQVEILRQVEEAIAGSGHEQLVWRVTNVSKNSPITFEITPYPKTYGTDIENRAANVVQATATGLSGLSEGGERPLHFTDKVLKKVDGVNKRVTNGLAETKIDFSNYKGAPNFELNTQKARATEAIIVALIKPAVSPHRELGSAEGYVKMVGRDGFGRPNMTIVTRLDRTDVKCISTDGGLDKIGHLEVRQVIKGLRVKVHGILHYKSPMHLDRINVERTELFPDDSQLPTVDDLIDPEFTGGQESVEYVRRMRADG